jgi:hypothetical protein
VKTSLFVLTVCFGLAAPATAQIHTWRDADGTLVLSDQPRTDKGEMTTYAVVGSNSFRATKPLVPSAKSMMFDGHITEHSRRVGVSADLVRAVIQAESAFNPRAVSSKGAMGLMQLMPATAVELGVRHPFDAEENIRGGVVYLKRLLDRYDQKVDLALAAYNAGIGNVDRYDAVPPFRETRAYVKRITETTPQAPPVTVIYRWMELVNGKPVNRISNKPPVSGAYDIITR